MANAILDYCGRVEIIHLRERTDRFSQISQELATIGIEIADHRVRIPEAPRPSDPYGFPSRGVYGNFLSHLDILRRARDDKLKAAFVLEDDAIFRSFLRRPAAQERLCQELSTRPWDFCFIGHALRKELSRAERGLVSTQLPFKWSHCYLVHQRALPALVDYLEATIERPVGHPDGGKMYVDGAFSLYRQLNPAIVTLVTNPVLSIQRGSTSSLGGQRWYDRKGALQIAAGGIRTVRDAVWRGTGVHLTGY